VNSDEENIITGDAVPSEKKKKENKMRHVFKNRELYISAGKLSDGYMDHAGISPCLIRGHFDKHGFVPPSAQGALKHETLVAVGAVFRRQISSCAA
jgi:hypothetical protein